MRLKTKLFGTVYQFKDIKEVLAKANEERSGDKLAGIAAESVTEMIAAKEVLSNLTLKDLRNNPVVPYEEDEVTRVIQDAVNEKIYAEIQNWTVAELREWILDIGTTDLDIRRISRGLTSEMIAAVAKLMTNLDLIYGANKIKVEAHCNTTIGSSDVLALRLQPNHPSDNVDGVLVSIYEGLSYGSGDAVIGFNPVNDSTENIVKIFNLLEDVKTKWEIPTQTSVLAHVTTQMEAIKRGAPADMIFQSIAGTQKGNEAFGVTATLLDEARELVLREGTSTGPNVMYFETGQGAELSSDAHNGVDQVTLEARCYGFAKRYQPFLVNTVVGFIGPEYLYDNKQVIRAGLEDHFMGKLTGISMGVDICHTNHMKADQNDLENLAVLLSSGGVNFIITAPQGDDVMLNYQSCSYHDGAAIREMLNLKPINEFEGWLEKMGLMENGKLTSLAGDASLFLK